MKYLDEYRDPRRPVVYTPMDAVRLAAELPDRKVVFLAVGFQTTAPACATGQAPRPQRPRPH